MIPINLIIVEDDAMVLEVNKQFIESIEGFKIVGVAKTGAEAKQIISKLKPKVVLLDYYLPDMNGLEVIRHIRTTQLDTDFILVTAAKDVETIQQIFRFGAIDYIIKPFRFERLKASLERYKSMVRKMRLNDELEQKDLDVFTFKNIKKLEENGIPKGLNEITLKQILNYMIKINEAQSAEEVAKGTGLSRVTVRRYLEYLEKTHRIKLEIQYGSVGRPINKYSI